MSSKIYIGSDHAGFALKGKLIPFLCGLGHEVVDCGPEQFDPADDYPKYILSVARSVAEDVKNGKLSKGIVIGGSGEGEAITANRLKGVRAATYYGGSHEIIKLSREHNDTNILSLGARFISETEAKVVAKLWLETKFSHDERHIRRIKEIDELS